MPSGGLCPCQALQLYSGEVLAVEMIGTDIRNDILRRRVRQ